MMATQKKQCRCLPLLRKQRGAAVVEFAILLIPLLILGFGTVEYGRAIYEYNTLVKSVRSAARMLSKHSPGDAAYATHREEARCLSVFGNSACAQGSKALATGLTKSNIKICDRISWSDCAGTAQSNFEDVATGSGNINVVVVRVSGYRFTLLGLPFMGNANGLDFGPIEAVMRQNG